MNTIRILFIFSSAILIHIYFGCGYTIVRDFDEEERQAEVASIDTLSFAPDLVISNIEYSYVPPPPRRDALDQIAGPSRVHFYITVLNIGNADFRNPFLIIYKYPNHYYPGRTSFAYRQCNKNYELISVDSSQIIEIHDTYPYGGGIYDFTLVTNPVIQRDLFKTLRSQFNGHIDVVKSRELRYDNNEFSIILPREQEQLDSIRHSK